MWQHQINYRSQKTGIMNHKMTSPTQQHGPEAHALPIASTEMGCSTSLCAFLPIASQLLAPVEMPTETTHALSLAACKQLAMVASGS